jgi:hypothetical protein
MSDRVDDSVGRIAYFQIAILFLVCIGVIMLYFTRSPAQVCMNKDDPTFGINTGMCDWLSSRVCFVWIDRVVAVSSAFGKLSFSFVNHTGLQTTPLPAPYGDQCWPKPSCFGSPTHCLFWGGSGYTVFFFLVLPVSSVWPIRNFISATCCLLCCISVRLLGGHHRNTEAVQHGAVKLHVPYTNGSLPFVT